MTVGELLERTSARELAEWMAFERAYGPLGNSYMERTLADVVDAVERLSVTFQVCLGSDPDDVVQRVPIPRPEDVYRSEDEAADEDDDTVEF